MVRAPLISNHCRRQPADRLLDHVVAQPADDVPGDRLPLCGIKIREQPAIHLVGVVQRPFELAGELLRERQEVGDARTDRGADHAVVAYEDEVGIFGDRLPQRRARDGHPPPLPAMAIVIVGPEIDDACAQEGPAVDPVLRALQPPVPHLLARHDLGRAHVARRLVRPREGKLVEGANLVRELLPELPERRVVGHDDDARVRERHAGRLGEGGLDERRARVRAGGLILRESSRASDRATSPGASAPGACEATGTCRPCRPPRASPVRRSAPGRPRARESGRPQWS